MRTGRLADVQLAAIRRDADRLRKKIGHAARFLKRSAETSQHAKRAYFLAAAFASSISFLHSAFILSSAVFGSILLQASIFLALSASLIAPP